MTADHDIDAARREDIATLGMYVFLASEIMLFGGLILVAVVLRVTHPQEVIRASSALHVWIATANTAVMLTSSLAVAIAALLAREGRSRPTAVALGAAAVLGVTFLALKAIEYGLEAADGVLPSVSAREAFSSPPARLFMDLYFVATGLHALHILVGVIVLSVVGTRVALRAVPLPRRAIVIHVSGLYWHLVDVIWIFLLPVLYLQR